MMASFLSACALYMFYFLKRLGKCMVQNITIVERIEAFLKSMINQIIQFLCLVKLAFTKRKKEETNFGKIQK
jgi:hypothetical protein